jgi:glutamate/tyrosine decarboxylase-like PLP-dependent enzyme
VPDSTSVPILDRPLLERAAELAAEYLAGLPGRPVRARASVDELRAALGGPLPEHGEPAGETLERLVRGAEPGVIASAGPRYFGFVVGGALPVALAADWLAGAWDQDAGAYSLGPSASVVEEVAGGWLLELLGLPPGASVGFTTGCQMANFTGLAAGRHAVLARAGWDVEARGLYGAPEIRVFAGEEAHVTIFSALQMLGLGRERVVRVAADAEGRMRPEALAAALAAGEAGAPAIVCAQAGCVSTGAFDPLEAIADLCAAHGTWLHVDGAFGLWAAASPALRHLTAGAARADSWATDGHKWLNVPYDCGVVACADPAAHRAAMSFSASYLVLSAGAERDPFDWVPESSRRARGFAVWAVLRHLGRDGVRALVERCCALARRMAARLATAPGVEVLNDVVLNQVLVRFTPPGGGDAERDAFTREVVRRVQEDGTCWLGGTTWKGRAAMRISVSGWATREEDADRSVAAILRAALR